MKEYDISALPITDVVAHAREHCAWAKQACANNMADERDLLWLEEQLRTAFEKLELVVGRRPKDMPSEMLKTTLEMMRIQYFDLIRKLVCFHEQHEQHEYEQVFDIEARVGWVFQSYERWKTKKKALSDKQMQSCQNMHDFLGNAGSTLNGLGFRPDVIEGSLEQLAANITEAQSMLRWMMRTQGQLTQTPRGPLSQRRKL